MTIGRHHWLASFILELCPTIQTKWKSRICGLTAFRVLRKAKKGFQKSRGGRCYVDHVVQKSGVSNFKITAQSTVCISTPDLAGMRLSTEPYLLRKPGPWPAEKLCILVCKARTWSLQFINFFKMCGSKVLFLRIKCTNRRFGIWYFGFNVPRQLNAVMEGSR